MKYFFIVFCWLCLNACTTPRVWIQSTTETGGVIGYQDYIPSSDNMARIKRLIPCKDFRKTWNGIKSQSTGAATYMYSSNPWGGGMMVPIDQGIVQWAEYHYECIGNFYNNTDDMIDAESDQGHSSRSNSETSEPLSDNHKKCIFIDYCRRNHPNDFKSCMNRRCN